MKKEQILFKNTRSLKINKINSNNQQKQQLLDYLKSKHTISVDSPPENIDIPKILESDSPKNAVYLTQYIIDNVQANKQQKQIPEIAKDVPVEIVSEPLPKESIDEIAKDVPVEIVSEPLPKESIDEIAKDVPAELVSNEPLPEESIDETSLEKAISLESSATIIKPQLEVLPTTAKPEESNNVIEHKHVIYQDLITTQKNNNLVEHKIKSINPNELSEEEKIKYYQALIELKYKK